MSARPDAIVIGAGVVGAAVANALARDELRVLVLDAGSRGTATAGGMGHIVVMDDSDTQFALTAWSRTLLHGLTPLLPQSCEVDVTGTLWIAEDEAQLEAARAKLAYYTERGVRAELLDEAALRDAEPALRHGLAGALRVPDDLVVYPPALADWLLRRAVERGARVQHAEVAAITGGARPSVRTAAGDALDASVVVNAAGIAAALLTPGLDIVPRRGHLAITDRYPTLCRHQLVELGYLRSAHGADAASVAFNLQPRRTGQLLIGSSREFVGHDARMNGGVLARMLARAVAFVPRLAALNAIRCWTALRPATPDHLPCIGHAPQQENVIVAAGHEGLGITTALATAELVADLVGGRTAPVDMASFAPARFAAVVQA